MLTIKVTLKSIPLLIKIDLINQQAENPPFANLNISKAIDFAHIYRSPGPIYDLDGHTKDWWRFSRALHAANIGYGDIVQNCFSYHFTPAGAMFEEAARILKCTVFPAGGYVRFTIRSNAYFRNYSIYWSLIF